MIFDSNSSVLVIFCRRPALGVGKRRIAAELGDPAALAVADLLLDTTLEDALAWQGPVVISPAAPEDASWAAKMLPDATIIPQVSGNLGTRISAVQRELVSRGMQRTIFIGSDSPALNPEVLHKAAQQLQDDDTVLVPARDGGVTLMGTRKPWPELINLPWGTPELGNALAAQCRKAGLTVAELEPGCDIDTRRDLLDAATSLAADQRPARRRLLRWIENSNLDDGPTVTAVVPVYRDTTALQALLERLRQLEPSIDEIVVVDGSADSDCCTLCAGYNATYLSAAANRGGQLKLGAANSTSDVLWFLHADSHPPRNAIAVIRDHLAPGRPGGFFRFTFGGTRTWYKRGLAASINMRTRFGIPYGDQGIFVRRSAYQSVGGHAATPLFEEVPLVKGLRKLGDFRATGAALAVAPRRWERDGWLRRSLHNRYLAIGFMLGVSPERLARYYGQPNDDVAPSKLRQDTG
jgi:rSAM/selenodomain-associated transferase 2/rSAM/selenodomain-associated transferase 1